MATLSGRLFVYQVSMVNVVGRKGYEAIDDALERIDPRSPVRSCPWRVGRM
jgi:hypothetical protein